MNKLSIVFFGAGPVAAESLKNLLSFVEVEAIVTKPLITKLKAESPVYELATENKIPILTASNKTELDQKIESMKFNSKLGVLIDFGIIVSAEVINKFPLGIVNSHFSLLPQLRGADPITFSILSGQKETGVSLMLLTPGMDEGPILAQQTLHIAENDTSSTLTTKLIELSNSMLKKSLELYAKKFVVAVDQLDFAKAHKRDATPTFSRKILKKDGDIDWSKPAEIIEREIRAFQPWPKSYTKVGDNLVITVIEAQIYKNDKPSPGKIEVFDNRLVIGAGKDALEITLLQPAGKKVMKTADFLRGNLNKLFVQ